MWLLSKIDLLTILQSNRAASGTHLRLAAVKRSCVERLETGVLIKIRHLITFSFTFRSRIISMSAAEPKCL